MFDDTKKQYEMYEEIVYGVLAKLSIYPFAANYEDLLQIGRLSLWELLTRQTFTPELDDEKFRGYLYTHIRWRILDELRKQNRQKTKEFCMETTKDSDEGESTKETMTDVISIKLMMEKLWPYLTENERIFFKETYFEDNNITAIAKKYHTSRKTVYKWRNSLALKAAKYIFK
ncbi:sigma-70 family RNA polymerase sigma factor [Vagococcus elongatus]|uniref:RNA polymerase sigma-70 region 2 domain-containing protein n=1 Tax=Vagococcus elongatus TaxID=180344 RepID=A0A430B1Q4_9ENTE|nr:sigma-70 family RNA polymerase sigma factor [Vagococcus elongatus]RSU14263.1 hypothetical protein CBF29_02880 [Vagococcus elongatus]